ncbi:hypothetical protein D9M71_315370 [compost metagenome]
MQVTALKQLRQWVADVVRVAQQSTVAVGPAQHFHYVMAALDLIGAAPGQALQHGQALRQGDAAGRGRWCADQFALIGQGVAQRFASSDPILRQVLQLPDAAGSLHAIDQRLCCSPGIEAVEALIGQTFERRRQFRLANAFIEDRYFTAM